MVHWSKTEKRDDVSRKISDSKRGKRHSPEWSENISKSLKGKIPKNIEEFRSAGQAATRTNWVSVCSGCGRKFTRKDRPNKKYKFCSKECHKKHFRPDTSGLVFGIRGKFHHNWKGGVTGKRRTDMQRIEYRNWRKSVFERDNYTCQECGKIGGDIFAHHVLPYSTHPDLRYSVDNGKTLCKACHRKPGLHKGIKQVLKSSTEK